MLVNQVIIIILMILFFHIQKEDLIVGVQNKTMLKQTL